jgi:glycosyltransferase involved in cell wall biosynthesis
LINFRGPLIGTLIERGHNVIACAPPAPDDVRAQLAALGADYYSVPLARAGLNPAEDLKALLSLTRLFRKVRPDIVLGYTVKPVIWGGLASRLARVPSSYGMITGLGYAFSDNGDLKQRAIGRVVCSLYRLALSHARAVLFQNPDDQAEFERRGLLPKNGTKAQINGSGVDLDIYTPQPMPDEPVFLLVARLLADKGIREYVEAARRIKRRYPQARFQLAGGFDPNPTAIKPDELRTWEEEGVIEYLGQLDDVRPAFAAARFYVLPSYREGTPRTVLEAMATGRPVITTDAPGCRETVVDGENGFLVPVMNAKSLRTAMEKLLEDPELAERMAQKGLERVREKYDVHKVNATIMEAMGL